jgi:hypothetical protein
MVPASFLVGFHGFYGFHGFHPNQKWMMTGGTPMTQEISSHDIS